MKTYGEKWSKHSFYKQDPFPEIPSALLNSLDIKRYVDKGCLLERESFDPMRMKPASYEMRFLGTLYDWRPEPDGKLKKRYRRVIEGDHVKLSSNSISYLWLKEKLRLPEYIAARFNLRISDVHKGILLGTGPLIDPGFGGQLFIPLHNLTDNDYILEGGQGIIWVEFTKVSPNPYWLPGTEENGRPAWLVKFPSRKSIDNPKEYLRKADSGDVQSAFKGALVRAERRAKDAESAADDSREEIKTIRNWAIGIGVGGLIAVAIGVAELWISAATVSGQVTNRVDRQVERIGELERKIGELEVQLNHLRYGPRTEPDSGLVSETGADVYPRRRPFSYNGVETGSGQ